MDQYRIQYNQGLAIPNRTHSAVRNGEYDYQQTYSSAANTQYSLVQEPVQKYKLYSHYISISSSNRDSTNYPLHYDYRINFDQPFKNIKEIELISAIFPNQAAASSGSDILNESHFVLDIDSLNYIEFPNNVGSQALKGFSILPLKPPTKNSGGFIIPELGCIYHKSRVFKTPLASLDHLNIKIRDSDGNLYDFGHPNGTTTKSHQNHFVFKITVEEVDRTILNNRNVF
jgi:hypothetical protein